jgi:hypothetical protein
MSKVFNTIEEVEAHNARVRAGRLGTVADTVQPATKPKMKGVSGVIRQSSRQPNKTELRFEQDYLRGWLHARDIFTYEYEAVTLKIANGCRYTPDWYVVEWLGGDGTSKAQFYEVKARDMIWDDAIVKIKVAAQKFPQFEFYLCAYSKTGWTIEKVLP